MSGGYGFEATVAPDRLSSLYRHDLGTDDLDFKIYFDAKGMFREYGRCIDEKWYRSFRRDVARELLQRGLADGLRYLDVPGLGLGIESSKVDMFVGDISECNSLSYFMKNVETPNGIMGNEYTDKYVIYSALHMFMLCHAIVVGGVVVCKSEARRVPKFKKILFRALLLVGDEASYEFGMDDEALRLLSSITWLKVVNDKSFEYHRYALHILTMTGLPRSFDIIKPEIKKIPLIPGSVPYGGGTHPSRDTDFGGHNNTSSDSFCLALDLATVFGIFEEKEPFYEVENDDNSDEITPTEIVLVDDIVDSMEEAGAEDDGATQLGGSAGETGKAVALLGCVGALIFATVVGSARR